MSESTFLRIDTLPPGFRGAIAVVLIDKLGGRESQILQDELAAAAGRFAWRLAVDFAAVSLLSSMGLGALVTLHRKCREERGVLAIYGLKPELVELLKITQLNRVLNVAPDVAGAMKAIA